MSKFRAFKKGTFAAENAIPVTSNSLAIYERSRAVWIGTSQNLDFSFDGITWITFQGCVAGSILPIQVIGVRITAGGANPTAGDINFLY